MDWCHQTGRLPFFGWLLCVHVENGIGARVRPVVSGQRTAGRVLLLCVNAWYVGCQVLMYHADGGVVFVLRPCLAQFMMMGMPLIMMYVMPKMMEGMDKEQLAVCNHCVYTILLPVYTVAVAVLLHTCSRSQYCSACLLQKAVIYHPGVSLPGIGWHGMPFSCAGRCLAWLLGFRIACATRIVGGCQC